MHERTHVLRRQHETVLVALTKRKVVRLLFLFIVAMQVFHRVHDLRHARVDEGHVVRNDVARLHDVPGMALPRLFTHGVYVILQFRQQPWTNHQGAFHNRVDACSVEGSHV